MYRKNYFLTGLLILAIIVFSNQEGIAEGWSQTKVYWRNLIGPVIIKPATDSTTAVQIQNSTGTAVVNVDTTNKYFGIGTTVPVAKLHLHENAGSDIFAQITNTDTGQLWNDGFLIWLNANEDLKLWHYEAKDIIFGITNTQRVIIKSGGAIGIGSNTSPASVFVVTPPAASTIVANDTITANACGTIMLLTADLPVTTNTTNTFTTPAAANAGCCMDVVNIGTNATNTITLDANTNFTSAGAADVVLGIGDSCRVCSNGASGKWFQIGDTGNN